MTQFYKLGINIDPVTRGVFLSSVRNAPDVFYPMKCTRTVCAHSRNRVRRASRFEVVKKVEKMAATVYMCGTWGICFDEITKFTAHNCKGKRSIQIIENRKCYYLYKATYFWIECKKIL